MKGKPIEPGCLAITLNALVPENRGRVVKVVQLYLAESPHNQRIWSVEFQSEVRTITRDQIEMSRVGNIPEAWLRRIDDGEDHGIDTTIDHDLEVTA